MHIDATLQRLDLGAADPDRMAAFYAKAFRMTAGRDGETRICRGPQRELRFSPGAPGRLLRAVFRIESGARFEAYRQQLQQRGVMLERASADRLSVVDPEGRTIEFTTQAGAGDEGHAGLPEARLQHLAVRTPQAEALVAFYVERLGFTLSDRVLDDTGALTAAFLRTDAEHHALAVFRSQEVRFDHFSCEVADWTRLRDWADHMADVGLELAWGVGRHGPGNDTFLMVRDPDGNMGEVSAELEICNPGRPTGVWPHRPQTLNRWGVAIMRS